MEEIDLSLPSKFMDACVAKDKDKALRLAKLMAKQHNCTLKAELDILDFDASILSSEYRLPIATMIKELKNMKHSAALITVAGMLICLGAAGFVVFVL
ncbi:hypothetical protein [Lactobacillus johnsonii]|uniref:hypothetical protein n=1 Tax=Lactobacillus johnsonii TaxID=33959 RepID=UPI001ADEC84C|nr:hypothetical protein [Lactobacillus johnsonii]